MLESAYARRTLGDDTVQRKRLVFSVTFRFDDDREREQVATCLFFGYVPPGTEVDIEYLGGVKPKWLEATSVPSWPQAILV